MDRCSYWEPGFICDRPLRNEREIADGCCASCASRVDVALERALAKISDQPMEVRL
jgi:hypothetical protein